jgi:hypothetical protein
MYSIHTGGYTLNFLGRMFLTVSSVDQREFSAIIHGTTGKTGWFALRTGIQGDGQMIPVDQVPAYRMTPVHRSRHRSMGIVLIEGMVGTPKLDKTIGIIHPALPGT